MIQLLSEYKQRITWALFVLFYLQLVAPVYAAKSSRFSDLPGYPGEVFYTNSPLKNLRGTNSTHNAGRARVPGLPQPTKKWFRAGMKFAAPIKNVTNIAANQPAIGGPSSPEATSFKAAGANNLVNLFTGNFSYSIPLLDVGGYPVNLFYTGGITMDQEASWVGLGWNINPGTVSRNMRGVPDDFNGTDSLIQEQNVKPNRTWGGEIGVDVELVGLKIPGSLNLTEGFSYNNYLGPAIDFGASTSISIASIQNISFAKSATANLGLTAGIGVKLGSRSGLTMSPSLNAGLDSKDMKVGLGIGLSTSYNSRTGIKDLNLSSQLTLFNKQTDKTDNTKSRTETSSFKLGSSTFSFARASYLPTIRFPMENSNLSGQIELGGGIFGFRMSATIDGYYSESRVAPESRLVKKPLVGFMYSQNATSNKDAVMDFNRLNDGEVTPNTPIISAPAYAYDIFSIQGEGTGGSIRAYRGELGFMRDNVTTSKDKNFSLGLDIAPPGHYGGNWNIISSPTKVGGWEDGNNTLLQSIPFQPVSPLSGNRFENVYFKNPGEASVSSDEEISRIGADNLVRFQLSGTDPCPSPRLESILETFNKKTWLQKADLPLVGHTVLPSRQKRTQITTMLTASEASQVGLEKKLRSYNGNFDSSNNILYDSTLRVGGYRKPHHISEINVLEQNGMRYVYGIPVYSVRQKDLTFTVDSLPFNSLNNLVSYDTTNEPRVTTSHMNNSSKFDGYVQTQETPGYASSFLLTGLLSPDYVDVTGDGITEDDLGGAVKFNYTKSTDLHKWRTPRKNIAASAQDLAHFNEGIRTESRDNKATISYGEREAWYLNSIESKSMVAIFKTDVRSDAKGVNSVLDGRINAAENANKKLNRIDLYTKAEIKSKGIASAIPIKSVFFDYSYELTNGSPDNATGGKLTLKDIYFTYNGQLRKNKAQYVFGYQDPTHTSYVDNPTYKSIAADRWGTYKDTAVINNPSSLSNIDYPYTDSSKVLADGYAGAWSLKKILLPSGGQLQVQYEADDYGYVQDRRACNMWMLYGLGLTTSFSTSNSMYNSEGSTVDNNYVYIKLPAALVNTDPVKSRLEIYNKYLAGINQMAFKLLINMPAGPEPLTVYANFDDYGLCTNTGNSTIIYIKLRPVNGKSPLATSAIGYVTGSLPAQAFPHYATEVNTLIDFLNLTIGTLASLKEIFSTVDDQMRAANMARTIVLAKSFVRMNNPMRMKLGGGARVKRVTLQDNWNKMTSQYNSTYGQDYDYTTTEKVNGVDMTISSGVASYEPGLGSEENPFREIASYQNQLPLASAIYGAIELPMLEGLYPSPNVGYSQVTVRSIHRKGTHGDSTVRSAVGKQVTQFFTARDYPTFSAYTPMKSMDYNKKPFFSLFSKEVINMRTISQGFLVETNDMHGKMKSQAAYSESDEKTPISASYHSYTNTGKNGMNDKVNFIYNDQGGIVKKGNMGIDLELMTDVREFKVETNGFNGQAQLDFFPPSPVPLPTLYPLTTYQLNLYRAVTCTKLINYHSIEDSVVVMDKGSIVSTKTIAYDAETGNPIVSQTANEFNDSVYNINYPAYWAYSSAGPAYKNIGVSFNGVNFLDGKITAGADTTIFESGDELYITNQGGPVPGCSTTLTSDTTFRIWAFDKNKNTTALTVPSKNIVFMDSIGRFFTNNNVSFRILRSGFRNNLGLTVSSAMCMKNPLQNNKLVVDSSVNMVSAAAIAYKEKWQVDNDVILRRVYYIAPCTTKETDSISCSGMLEKKINPYVKGLVGNLKPYRSYTYYGSRNDSDVTVLTAIRKNGYINNFSNYWGFNTSSNLVPDYTNAKWVWNSELTKVNAKGQELETRDALNRYTAAQYGFNKNMPVALVQNARYGESFCEGFEDFKYGETLNKSVLNNCDNNKYASFIGLGNSAIINTDTTTVKSHTGKYALLVNKASQAIKSFTVKTSFIDSFNLKFLADTTLVLNNEGGNNQFGPPATDPLYLQTPTVSFAQTSVYITMDFRVPSSHQYSAGSSYNFYINILTGKVYNFQTTLNSENRDNSQCTGYSNGNNVTITSVYGNTSIGTYASQGKTSPYNLLQNDSAFLCPGIYQVQGTASQYYQNTVNPTDSYNSYSWVCGNCNSKYYQNLSTQNGCPYTHPLPASDSMLNQQFAFVPGKRMQFSAWVKEDSDSLVNYRPSYVKNHIELRFPGSSTPVDTLYPSGGIIEGWQKIEGEFTVPLNATTASLVLSNDSTKNVYYDDIRIHPFNANMKSYVYDPRTLKLAAELDENNYASFYEYDEEGQLVRVKKETIQGIKTIKETRNGRQKIVTVLQ